MRKVMMISGLALAIAGCANQQESPGQVPVRDLSASRESTSAGHYTVEAGDTLYGIAWRHDMDYRDLARLNRIGPPYQIQPGQRLVLDAEAAQSAGEEPADDAASGVVATPLGGDQGTGESSDMEWLLPDEEAIERNRRLSAEPLEEAEGPSGGAVAGAIAATGDDSGPGPIYSPDSPGADGGLSERDLAERRERDARGEQAEEADETVDVAEAATAEDEPVQEAVGDEAGTAQADADEADAGTAVAGGTQGSEGGESGYTPVDEVAWQWPVDGEVVGRFGDGGSITAGIDIAGQKGQPVKAAGPGIVVYAGSGVRGYGKLILLKHNDQYLSAYAHNDTLNVSENDVVQAGEVIATMGDSDAEDVRLHFEVRKDGQPQDPLEFLPPR